MHTMEQTLDLYEEEGSVRNLAIVTRKAFLQQVVDGKCQGSFGLGGMPTQRAAHTEPINDPSIDPWNYTSPPEGPLPDASSRGSPESAEPGPWEDSQPLTTPELEDIGQVANLPPYHNPVSNRTEEDPAHWRLQQMHRYGPWLATDEAQLSLQALRVAHPSAYFPDPVVLQDLHPVGDLPTSWPGTRIHVMFLEQAHWFAAGVYQEYGSWQANFVAIGAKRAEELTETVIKPRLTYTKSPIKVTIIPSVIVPHLCGWLILQRRFQQAGQPELRYHVWAEEPHKSKNATDSWQRNYLRTSGEWWTPLQRTDHSETLSWGCG